MTSEPASLPFRVEVADLPTGVAAMVVSSAEPHEIRKGETAVEALVRLRRAVVLRDDDPARLAAESTEET